MPDASGSDVRFQGLPAPTQRRFDLFARICGCIVLGLGGVGCLAGVSGHLDLARVHPEFVPMALSTAVCFLMTGGVLVSQSQTGTAATAARRAGAGFVALAGMSNILGALAHTAVLNPLEQLAEKLQASLWVPYTSMSPATGALFCVTGLSLVLLLSWPGTVRPQNRSVKKDVAGVLATLTGLAGLTLAQGYLLGNPMFYGGGLVPVALLTSLGFLATGVGISCQAGVDALPLRPFQGETVQARLLRTFLPLIAAIVLAQPLLSHLANGIFKINSAFLNSLWAMAFASVAVLMVLQAGRRIGRSLDLAESSRAEAESALRESEERFRVLVEHAPEAILVIDTDQEGCLEANAKAVKLFGCSRDELLKFGHHRYLPPHQPDQLPVERSASEHRRHAMAGGVVTFERAVKNANGDEVVCEVRLVRLPSAKNNLMRSSWIDITQRKSIEEAAERSLREKETLLKEIHHRVKNNLQILMSLINLQAENIKDPKIAEEFYAMKSRIRSIALVHEGLYHSPDLGAVEMRPYIANLVQQLASTYSGTAGAVRLTLDMDDAKLPVDKAIPMGLLVNELATNAFKYAFTPAFQGELKVGMRKMGETISLVVEDNGQGLPEAFDINSVHTLGMQLILALTDQVDGKIRVSSGNGTRFEVEFTI